MELRDLQNFLAVASHLSFRKGAESRFLGISQISRSIAGLERELGGRLLERTTRTVTLTDAGRELVPKAQDVLARVEALTRSTRNQLSEHRKITIGSRSLLPELISSFRELIESELPRFRTDVLYAKTPAQIEALLRGEIDLGFIAGPMIHREFGFLPAYDETIAIAVPDRPEFRSLPWVGPEHLTGLGHVADGDLYIDGNMSRYINASAFEEEVNSGVGGALYARLALGDCWTFTFLDQSSTWHRLLSGPGVIVKPTQESLTYRTHLAWLNWRDRSDDLAPAIIAARRHFSTAMTEELIIAQQQSVAEIDDDPRRSDI